MSSGFDATFATGKELVADFWANKKFHAEAEKQRGKQL
jgi:hypothetical protein